MDYNEDSAVAYIRKNATTTRKYSADDVLEIIDIIWDYYEAKGLLSLDFDEDDDSADGPDIDDLVAHTRKVLAKDKGTRILAEDVPALIQAELEYEAALEQDDEE